MTTYALPISEGLADRLASLPPEKVSAVNTELAEVLAEIIEEEIPLTQSNYPLNADDLAAIGRGLAEVEAGLEIDGQEAMTALYKRVGLVYERK